MITGSCLCANAKYEISAELGDIVHCHCQTCRKAHGAAFSSVAAVNDKDFTLLNNATLSRYESSPGKQRYFCANCGTQIYAKKEGTQHIVLRLGSLDNLPELNGMNFKEKCHIWTSQKASWYALNTDLPVHSQFE